MATSFWEGRDLDKPYTLGGFNGTWAFSDHNLIPNDLNNFILESFHPQERIKRIPLEDINKLLNDVWEGPGSMAKLERLYHEMKAARLSKTDMTSKDTSDVKTIDDYSDEEKSTINISED
jgi:hypothetical protein